MDYHINRNEEGYLGLLQYILDCGIDKSDRTGVGTRSIFGAQLQFDLWDHFPALTTKRVHMKSVFSELSWLISGSTNVFPMLREGVTIWNEWADDKGELGPVYGKQWRAWNGVDHYTGKKFQVDQLQNALDLIKDNPDSRRIIVSAWNPSDVGYQALPPCHSLFQFVVEGNSLSCHMYQRSADVFLGVPFNIASYAALTQVMAQLGGKIPGKLTISFGDVHVYNNHFDQVKEQLSREIKESKPWVTIDDNIQSLADVRTDIFSIHNYDPHPTIKAEVAV